MDKYSAFKHILEYFVAHLEYVQNGKTTGPGYKEYIQPLVSTNQFYKTGQGYKGNGIQNGISEWADLPDGAICINVQQNFGPDYTTRKCYLNWQETAYNVIAKWKNSSIISLNLGTDRRDAKGYGYWEPFKNITVTPKELGLFDGTEVANSSLIFFYDAFCELYNTELKMETISYYADILKSNCNLILNGAPGTGKTYLAKDIAAQMICGVSYSAALENDPVFSSHYSFVQFHPSYDYTDFVEGLRPKKDAIGNISFERKDGVFKSFCKDALENSLENGVDNFDEAWNKLIEYLNEYDEVEISLLSGSKKIKVELNTNGDGLAQRTYDDDTNIKSKDWIRGKSKFFNKEQLYNVYQGLPGIPSGGHDNYRKAIVAEMKKKFGLKDYKPGVEKKDKKGVPYVFIIDEINRGEISKIFGELFFSIDRGYRGIKGRVKTQYQNLVDRKDVFYDGFFIPENVYIIGTMNDIDRSVESMDFAMRRRFAFEEIFADSNTEMLNNIPEKDIIIARMTKLNEIISNEPELGTSYQVGGAYFAKVDDCRNTNQKIDWNVFWDRYLRGLINEYTRGLQNRTKLLDDMKAAIIIDPKESTSANS